VNRLADVAFSTLHGIPVAHITGEIDASNASRLQRTVLDHVDNSDTGLVIDLTATTYMDSAGTRLLYEISQRLNHRSQALRVAVPATSPIRRILEITKLDTLIAVDDTAQHAAETLTSPPHAD
jgi:anti-anti-sigma factor